MAPVPPVRAPEIDRDGLVWFNTAGPLGLAALRGKLVILDFWTFCCINCMHIIPTLRRVEETYPDEVAVIGVHSPKFAAEKDPENVARAIARYGIVHPVVHDPDFRIWRDYAVRAWPTLVFVSPGGQVIGQVSGEPDPGQLLEAVGRILEEAGRSGTLEPRPLPLSPRDEPSGRFRYPGKLKPVPGGRRRWALADGGHHQIVLLDEDGGELARYGSGAPGLRDGTAEEARFDGPQGLVADESAIYVADTGNHAIRRIDLASGRVEILAGTGRRGRILGEEPREGASTALASPWDLALAGGRLFFANAGTHQLGMLHLATRRVARLAGSGAENIVDGPAPEAALAQPSGLALSPDGRALYFVDSETSSVRALDLENGRVETLVGTGLFDFGHANGPFPDALLQHPLGIGVAAGDRLLVADSYNAEIRVLDLMDRSVADLDGGSFECRDPVCLPLGEPAGVQADGADRVLLVDTNNHRILAYDLDSRSYRTWAA